jgi:ATP-dependent Clp protease ATP-binding subunit ClpC
MVLTGLEECWTLVGMFERFTANARRVIVQAQDEARRLQHNYIGTEHVLLGLLGVPDGLGGRALAGLGLSLEGTREEVTAIIGTGSTEPSGRIPFTPRAKKVLELARREAFQLGHHYIGTEHLLLGMIREGEGVAAQVLAGLGADLNGVRQQVLRLLHGSQGQDEPGSARGARRRPPGRRQRGLLPEVLARVESIDAQLSAIGQRVGAGPETGDLDQQIAQARRGKEAAAGEEDYESAAALRDTERQLLAGKAARQQEWAAAHPEIASLTGELHRLGEEVGRLRDFLRQQGIDPQHGAA